MGNEPGVTGPATPSPRSRSGRRRLSTAPSELSKGWLYQAANISWRFLLIAAAVAVIAFVIRRLSIIVLPSIAALFITTLLYPAVSWLRRHGWPSMLASWAVILIALLVFAGAIVLIAAPLRTEVSQVAGAFEEGVDQVLSWLGAGPLGLSQPEIERYLDGLADEIRANGRDIAESVAAGALRTVEVIAEIFLTLVLTFFFLKDGSQMKEWLLAHVPERRQPHVEELSVRAWTTIGSYLRGIALIALIDALLIGAVLLIIGVPLILPLVLLVFIGGFFPIIGAVVAGVVASLVALVSNGPLDAALVAAAILVIQQIEGNVLQPAVMSRVVSLHPVVILLALTAGATLFGLIGAFLAVPLTAVATSTASYFKTLHKREPPAENPGQPAQSAV